MTCVIYIQNQAVLHTHNVMYKHVAFGVGTRQFWCRDCSVVITACRLLALCQCAALKIVLMCWGYRGCFQTELVAPHSIPLDGWIDGCMDKFMTEQMNSIE